MLPYFIDESDVISIRKEICFVMKKCALPNKKAKINKKKQK
jgi:hypothetical protein